MYSRFLTEKMRSFFSAVGLTAQFHYVDMRATFTLSNSWNGGTAEEDGASVFNTRAINEWTFNG